MTRRAARSAAAAAAALVLALAACGVPEDDKPRMVSDGAVPFGLLETTTTTASTTVTR